MTWYVIIFFAAVLIGMAISVAAFGTGGKRKRVFRDIYFSVEDNVSFRPRPASIPPYLK